MKIDYLITIIENLVNNGSDFDFKVYDALKMDNVDMDTKKINGIARVSGGSVEPIGGLGNAQLSMQVEFIYPQERNDFVKQHLMSVATSTAGLVIQNSAIDEEMVGTTGVDIIFPTQGNYSLKNIGETMRCFIICYFDLNEKSVLSNDVKMYIQSGIEYNPVEVDEESVGDFYIIRNIQAGEEIEELTFLEEPIQPTIEEYDSIAIDFLAGEQQLKADYGIVGDNTCFRVDYPETETDYGKYFYSWNDGEVLNESYSAGWNRYKQDKEYTFGNLISNPFGTSSIQSMTYNDGKIYCGGGSATFAIYDISSGEFGSLIYNPFGSSNILSMTYNDGKIYCGGGGKFAIYNISSGTFGSLISTPFGTSAIIAMVYDNNKIYCGGEGNKFAIYDISSGTFGSLISNPFGIYNHISSMVYDNGKIYCGSGGNFAIYNISSGEFGSLITNPFGTSNILSMTYNDGKIYCGGGGGKFAIYNISSGEFGSLIYNPFGSSNILSMTYNDGNIYCGGGSGKFAIYNISSGEFGSLITTPFDTSTIRSMIYNDGKIYCGGNNGMFAIAQKLFIVEPITEIPTYSDVFIISSNMWHIMKDFVEYTGADKYLKLVLPTSYEANKYEEFYEQEILWENIPYFKKVISRHRLSNTNKFLNNKEMLTINNGQSFDISIAVPSIKGSVINSIKDDLLLGDNLNKSYNFKLTDEGNVKYFNNMIVSGDFEQECIPGNSVILKLLFVYKRA